MSRKRGAKARIVYAYLVVRKMLEPYFSLLVDLTGRSGDVMKVSLPPISSDPFVPSLVLTVADRENTFLSIRVP
jgi:hypothetical protein